MSYFVQRGFSENTVKSKVEEVLSVPREQALIYKKGKNQKSSICLDISSKTSINIADSEKASGM